MARRGSQKGPEKCRQPGGQEKTAKERDSRWRNRRVSNSLCFTLKKKIISDFGTSVLGNRVYVVCMEATPLPCL